MTRTPAVCLAGVSAGYGGPPIIDDVTLTIERGEFLGVVGPNGGGKSTLLKVILGLIEPESGTVEVLGTTPRRARRGVGYVPQYATFSRDFPISVRDVVLSGRLGRTRARFGFTRKDRAVADRCLEEVEIADLGDAPVGQLSGGQFQRVLIARALATEPELLLLDEPTANVDPRLERDVFDLLRDFHRSMTIVVVSHDVGFVSEYVSRVACVNHRLVRHTTEPLDAETLARLYERPVRVVDHHGAH